MNAILLQLAASAWLVLWVTTVYSYLGCGIVSVIAGSRYRGDRVEIDRAIDRYIISPFYMGTLFSLIAVLLYTQEVKVLHAVPGHAAVYMIALAVAVLLGQFLLEIVEGALLQHDILRIFKDHEAIGIFGIASLVYAAVIVVAKLSV
jgi:hypothetical protein